MSEWRWSIATARSIKQTFGAGYGTEVDSGHSRSTQLLSCYRSSVKSGNQVQWINGYLHTYMIWNFSFENLKNG